jgi:Fic family protein
MRLPPTPPPLKADDFERTFSLLARPDVRDYVAAANDKYLHWEKLRHQPRPADLSAEDAWCVVKMSRMGQRRPLPLCDVQGHPFSYWLPDPALSVLHEVDRWGGTALGVGEGTPARLGALRDRLIVSSLMEEAIATSQIEGAVTTRKAAKEMLRTNRKPRDRSEQMIVNSYRTIRMLCERLERPLTVGLLHEIQESMTRDALDDPAGAGRFRGAQDEVHVIDSRDSEIMFTPPPAEKLPERIEKLLEFANWPSKDESFIHPLVKASILHFWLAYEHPYVDGNGRTARALFYWSMLKNGYWLFEFLTISRIIVAAPMKYYRSFLYSEHDVNDLTYSLMYQIRATQKALRQLHRYLAEKQEEQQRMAAALRRFPGINARQRAVLDAAFEDPSRVFTFQSHQTSHNITKVTARNDLLGLLERGLLAATKVGRQRGFLAAENLTDMLDSDR